MFGKVNATLRNNLKGAAKELGIEGVDFEAVDPTEGIKSLAKTVKDSHAKLMADLEAAKKGGAPTKELEQLQATLDAKAREVEALGKNAKEWESKYLELDSAVKQRESRAKEDAFYEEAISALRFKDGTSKFAIDGFKLALRNQYKPDFSDGAVKVLDANGNLVMEPNKAQTYRSIVDIAKELAEKENLTGGSPQGNAPVRKNVSTMSVALGTQTPQQPAQPGGRVRRVMPAA